MSSIDDPSGGSRATARMGILALGGTQLVLCALASRRILSPEEALAVHAVMVAVLIAPLAIGVYLAGYRRPAFFVALLLVAALGPLGLAGAMLVAALAFAVRRNARPFEGWRHDFLAQNAPDAVAELDMRLARSVAPCADRSSVVSFRDLMKVGTLARKQAALGMVADHYEPGFDPVLRSALNAPELIVRVQAASIAARLENGFQKRASALQGRLATAPQDRQAAMALAELHEEYACSGLADEDTAQDARGHALALYADLEKAGPTPPRVALAQARLLARSGRPREAVERLLSQTESGDPDSLDVALVVSGLLREGQFGEVRRLAAALVGAGRRDEVARSVRDLLEPWLGASAARSVPR